MVEAPEARVLAAQLNRTVKGKRITEVVAGHTPHKFAWFNIPPEEFQRMLTGKITGEAQALGGMVEIAVEDMSLVLSEGINIRYLAAGEKLPAKHQLLIGFEDDSCITVSVRMYGGLVLFPKGRPEGGLKEYYDAAREKPQVMSDGFSYEYFASLLSSGRAGKLGAKAFLATDQAIPGLGNGVLQDILYNARIHPKTKVAGLSPEKRDAMYTAIRETLDQMYEAGGRNSETDLFGNPGGYIPHLSKDTAGKECHRCGQLIVKENYMGGSIYYCPGCQRQ